MSRATFLTRLHSLAANSHFRKDLLLSRSRQYAYQMVPKAGNSTVKRALWATEVKENNFPHVPPEIDGDLHLRTESPFFPATDHQEMALPETFFFTFVRNPYTRAMSGWHDKSERLGKSLSFIEYLRIIARKNPHLLDHHFAPQSLILAPNIVRYDFIGSVENMDSDLAYVLDRIFKEREEQNEYEPRNASKKLASAKELLTGEAVDLIRTIFSEDFKMLGYSLDPNRLMEKPQTRRTKGMRLYQAQRVLNRTLPYERLSTKFRMRIFKLRKKRCG